MSQGKPFPDELPPDLRARLEEVIGRKSFGAACLWGEIHEWLEKHGIDAPDTLPPRETYDGRRDQ